jgi:hypothetical protein
MKLIIAGGRYYDDYDYLVKAVDDYLGKRDDVEIVSGGQVTRDETGKLYGADYLGECYAKQKGFKIKKFPAEWNKYGKQAGPMRNLQMADYADALIAFWDGKSKGTKNMIDFARAKSLEVKIEHYPAQ